MPERAWRAARTSTGSGAAGERGVDHVLQMFDADVRRIMALIGAHDVAALTPALVSVPTPR